MIINVLSTLIVKTFIPVFNCFTRKQPVHNRVSRKLIRVLGTSFKEFIDWFSFLARLRSYVIKMHTFYFVVCTCTVHGAQCNPVLTKVIFIRRLFCLFIK